VGLLALPNWVQDANDGRAMWTQVGRYAAIVALVAAAGCLGDPARDDSGTAGAGPTGSASAAPRFVERAVPLRLGTSSSFPDTWRRAMQIGYGPAAELLGQADSHGGQTAAWGPEYGAPAADGSWWFIDVEKHRLAHYDPTGRYLGAVAVPGRYLGVQYLHVFADGSMWASGGALESLVSDGRTARRVQLAVPPMPWGYDDGRTAYGGVARDDLYTLRVVNGEPLIGHTEAYRTPTGSRFRLYFAGVNAGPLVLELFDAKPPLRLRLDYRYRLDPKLRLLVTAEVAAGTDGTIHLLLEGSTDQSTHPQSVSGYLSISPAGRVSPLESTPNPWNPSSPGTAAHLHVAPGGTAPSMVFVETDAVRVYTRTAT
jgi:hypothetical protein